MFQTTRDRQTAKRARQLQRKAAKQPQYDPCQSHSSFDHAAPQSLLDELRYTAEELDRIREEDLRAAVERPLYTSQRVRN